jgi:N-acyl-L-homoserine lactone synthetase
MEVARVTCPKLLRSLFKFRYRVYVEQLGFNPPSVDHSLREFRDAIDNWSVSFAIIENGNVHGSLRIAHCEDCPDKEWLRNRFNMDCALEQFGEKAIGISSRFAVDISRHDAKRCMVELMKVGYEYERDNNRRCVFGDCSPNLLGFYRHIGYRAYTAPFVDETFGIKLPIVLIGQDRAFLTSVRSPLKRLARDLPDDCVARDWFTSNYAQQEREIRVQYIASCNENRYRMKFDAT